MYLFRRYGAHNWSFGIAAKGRLKYASQFTITVRYMTPAFKVISYRDFFKWNYLLTRKEYLFFAPSLSLLITLPRTIRLLLMCFPSFKRTPPAPVLAILSDPAKSTKFYFGCSDNNKINNANQTYK